MTGPLDRPADPTTTPAMTDEDVELLWRWAHTQIAAETVEMGPHGLITLLREIDRARAAEKKLTTKTEET